MTATTHAVATAPVASIWQPEELGRQGVGWRALIGPLISSAVLIAAVLQMRSLDLAQAFASLPARADFWLALAGAYMTLPLSEWLIYRGLWRLPPAGLIPLIRKRISNEILLGYSGEVYFYAWARRHARLAAAPFGVIKDVSILSAQAGNLATLAMLGLAWPLLGRLHLGGHERELLLSCIAVVAMALPPMLMRRQLLTLPARRLWAIAGLHLARIAVTMGLTGAMWHAALPAVALSWWVVLAALRQLLTRLPLLPNRDIVFAGLAIYLIGPHVELVAMIAMTATLTLAIHVVLGVVLALVDLVRGDTGAVA